MKAREFKMVVQNLRVVDVEALGDEPVEMAYSETIHVREVIPLEVLVDRFLSWPVPTSVCPDNLDADGRMRPGAIGTNLLSAAEARQMLKHVLNLK